MRRVEVFRLENGLIVEFDAVQDNLSMARQLGLELRLHETLARPSIPEHLGSSKNTDL